MEEQTPLPQKSFTLIKILVGLLTSGLTFWLLLVWVYSPSLLPLVFFEPTITPTFFTSTPQSTFTPQPSGTTTQTSTPTTTPTPFPQSSFLVDDVNAIRPPFDFIGGSIIILDELDALVNPPLDNIQWITSETISQDLGYDIVEPYHATFGPGSVTWFTDLPLKPALYEIFVLDTFFSSGGELTFTVRLDDITLYPLVGNTTIQYQSSQGEPPQYSDLWQSIGIYDLPQAGIISVSTEWGQRDNRTIVAIDRILILEHTDRARRIVEQLPIERQQITIVDDLEAVFTGRQYWDYWEDPEAWGEQYQLLSDPPTAASVTWTAPQLLPWGEYEVYAWVPKINGIAPATYQLYAGGVLQLTAEGVSDVTLSEGQGRAQPSQWLLIGSYQIPERYGDQIRIRLILSVDADVKGDVVADAVAFIRK